MTDINLMTIAEYELRMEAFQLQQLEKQNLLAEQAWFNQLVKSTTGGKHPKPKFKHLSDLFDYQKEIDKVRSQYEPNYIPESMLTKNEIQAEIFVKRHKEFEKLWQEHKIQRKGG